MNAQEVSKQPEGGAVRFAAPRVEICETDKALLLVADMPGVGPNGANIEFADNAFTIEGAVEKSVGGSARHYRRRFTVADPALFDLDRIAARMSHGVLEVEIPKAAKPEPRQIKITAA